MNAASTLVFRSDAESDAARRERYTEQDAAEQQMVEETGQSWFQDTPWCFICSRATDHTGEHTDAQLRRWRSLAVFS